MESSQAQQTTTTSDLEVAKKFHETIGRFHAYLRHRKRFPHAGQWKIIKAFFRDGKKIILVQAGRKFGKTETLLYIAWRFAIENPGAQIYIIAPTKEQGKKIYWSPRRLQYYGPREFLQEGDQGIRESEKTIRFKFCNDEGVPSSITIDGCDNIDALRGINPDLVFYEEVQDHTEEFDSQVMRNNLAAKDAAIVAIGTPPERECFFSDFRNEVITYESEGDPKYGYFEATTHDNPRISRDWLKRTEERLTRKGLRSVYEREILAKYVLGGASAVLPVWHKVKSDIITSHTTLMNMIRPDLKRIDWYTFTDPGQVCFAVLLIGVNRYTSQIYVVDGIYEKDRYKTTVGQIWPRVIELQDAIFPDEEKWQHWYDPAASWFQVDLWDRFHVAAQPCKKQKAKDSKAISRIIDILMAKGQLMISDRLVDSLVWEWDNWVRKENGELPDKDDHCIDLFFYFLRNIHLSVIADVDESQFRDLEDGDEHKKDLVTLKSFLEEKAREQDPFRGLGETIMGEDQITIN